MQKGIFAREIWFYINHSGILYCVSKSVLDMDQAIENKLPFRDVYRLVYIKSA